MSKLAVRVHGEFYGYIEGNVYVKEVYGSRHKLRMPEAWAFDAETFDKLIRPSCSEIVVIDRETGKRYRSTMKNFVENKGEIDRKYGRQYFMILSYWGVT